MIETELKKIIAKFIERPIPGRKVFIWHGCKEKLLSILPPTLRYPFTFVPSLKSKNIYFYLSYTDVKGKEQKEQKRIGYKVIPSKGKVEIDTSALDRLD